jgi:hypothetical protein
LIKVVTFLARLIRNAILFAVCVCVVLFIVLSIAEIPLHARIIDAITARLSTDFMSVHIDRATVSLRQGLVLNTAQVRFNLETNDLFVQAQEVRCDLSIRPGRPWIEWLDGVRLVRPEAVFLPAAMPRGAGTPAPVRGLQQMRLSRVLVELENPVFCGIAPTRVTADLSMKAGTLGLDNLRAEWRSSETESITGSVRMDLQSGRFEIKASGSLCPTTIRPILVLVRCRSGIHYCDRITSPEVPLSVSCDLLLTPDVQNLRFDIQSQSLSWNNIALTRVACGIVAVNPGTPNKWHVTLAPLQVASTNGSARATLVYEDATGLLQVDAQSQMPTGELFRIIELFQNGILDRVIVGGVPHLTVSGTIDADSKRLLPYDLKGTIRAPSLSLYGIPMAQTTCDFTVRNQYNVAFNNLHAKLANGGDLSGRFSFDLTANTPEMPYRAELAIADATLRDLLRPLTTTNLWEGGVSGAVTLSGTLATNQLESLAGNGSFALAGAVLSRVPLFAGLTEYMARNIPGVDLLVSQSDASLSFQAGAGEIRSSDLLVEGDIFSMLGKGSYNFLQDDLNVTVRANIFRKDSIAGRVTRIISLPFSRLLLEFHVAGSASQPRWNYRGIIQRIVGTVTGPEADQDKVETPRETVDP